MIIWKNARYTVLLSIWRFLFFNPILHISRYAHLTIHISLNVVPTGGVIVPIQRLKIIIIPKWIVFIPSFWQIGFRQLRPFDRSVKYQRQNQTVYHSYNTSLPRSKNTFDYIPNFIHSSQQLPAVWLLY